MPSKLEYELIKLRGEATDTKEVYTDSIAALKDSINALEEIVKSLETTDANLLSKANNAFQKASRALGNASGALKNGGTISDCNLNDCVVINDVTGNYNHGKLGMHNNKLCIGTGTAWEIITSAIIE